MFRGLAIVLVPIVLVVGLELALRVFGVGQPSTFLVRKSINGRECWVDNEHFGRLFFPAAIARNPPPTILPTQKPEGTYRILLFGESAALGDPRPGYGMGRFLEVMLQERFPAGRFEVVPIAMTAINSHALRRMARESRRYDGDLWIVYAGNNEMVGPYGAATVFGPKAPSLSVIRASLALRSSRIGQALASWFSSPDATQGTNQAWTGLKMFLDHRLPPDDPARSRVEDHFERNLEAIVRAGFQAGVPVLLSTVAVNLKECAPFASEHPSSLNPETRDSFDRAFLRARTNEARGDWEQASRDYRDAASLDPRFAEVQFRLGQALMSLNQHSEAADPFSRARDEDALPFRAGSRLNAVIERVAARNTNRGVRLVDSAGYLASAAPAGIPGRELFFEHVHPNFQGNYLLALFLAQAIAPLVPEALKQNPAAAWATPEICAARLGLTEWNQAATLELVLRRLSDAPFTNQINSMIERGMLAAQLIDLRTRMTPERSMDAFTVYRQALLRRTNDFRLHENFAEFLEAADDAPAAIQEWEAVKRAIPHHFGAYVQVARLQGKLGRLPEARTNLQQALRLEPRSADAHVEMAQVLMREGKPREATASFREALRLQPANARVHVLLADALAKEGDRSAALKELQAAVAVNPFYWEARYLLGVELGFMNRLAEAQSEFESVVRLKPDHTLAHLNLGVVLAQQGKFNPAREQFEEVLRIDPGNPKARQHLETLASMLTPAGTTTPPFAPAQPAEPQP